MGFREKTQDDLDLETLIDLFDTALTSNNPAMKKAIKNLLLVSTLIDSDLSPEQRIRGPLRQALEDMRDLTRRMDRIEQAQNQRTYTQPGTPLPYPAPMPSYPTGPTWTVPNTNWPSPSTGTPPGTIIGNGGTVTGTSYPNSGTYSINCKTTASTTAFDDQFLAERLLTKLEDK